jgi:1-acyl-sn-glycerol-3-phosphate acyltransferase
MTAASAAFRLARHPPADVAEDLPELPGLDAFRFRATRAQLARWTAELLGPPLDPNDLGNRDPDFVEAIAPLFWLIARHYFRGEGEGLEHVPRSGQVIGVGIHSGAPLLPDVWGLGAYWVATRGVADPAYILVHDLPLRIPVLGNLLMKVGALRASPKNADRALASGATLLVFPGGDRECARPFWTRDRVDLRGNTGFIKLAYRYGVPIVPFVNVGGHEVYFTLFSSDRLARWLGLTRWLRVKSVPLNLGLPWGLWWTAFLPYLPLPAKIVYRCAEPIPFERDPRRAEDPVALRAVYERVVDAMQSMVDDLARRRRFPVLG